MKRVKQPRINRQLVALSLLAAIGSLSAGHAAAVSCNGVTEWNSATTYAAGNKSTQAGSLFEAKWSTQNQSPSLSGEWDAWKKLGTCDSATTGGLELILRESKRTLTIAPGGEDFVATPCLAGEVAVTGGPTSIPSGPTILYSTLSYDGNRSGWMVQYKNTSAATITITPATSVTCTKGKISLGQ